MTPQPEIRHFNIRSEPPAAHIYINTHDTTRSTPYTFTVGIGPVQTHVPPHKTRISLLIEGYTLYDKDFLIPPHEDHGIKVYLNELKPGEPQPQPPTERPIEYKTTITANVEYAKIYIDDIYTNHYATQTYTIGTGTPETHISPGTRKIRLEKSPYQPMEKTVTIPTSSHITVHFDLQSPPPEEPPVTRYATITANISSARIFVDDVYTSHYAPEKYKIGDGDPRTYISPGQRIIKLERTNYTTVQKTVNIPTNADINIHFELFIQEPEPPEEPPEQPPEEPPITHFSIRSNPTGAHIYINTHDTTRATPYTFTVGTGPLQTHVPPDKNRISLLLEGYRLHDKDFIIPSEKDHGLNVYLAKLKPGEPPPQPPTPREEPPPGEPPVTPYVTITANISSARIFVDDVYTRHYAPEKYKIGDGDPGTYISPGQRVIKLERTNYTTVQKTVNIPTDADIEIHFELFIEEPTEEPPTADLKVRSNPSNADIYIDGKNTGETTVESFKVVTHKVTYPDDDVTVGTHTVTVKLTDYKDASKTVTVKPYDDLEIEFDLQRSVPAPPSIYAPPMVPYIAARKALYDKFIKDAITQPQSTIEIWIDQYQRAYDADPDSQEQQAELPFLNGLKHILQQHTGQPPTQYTATITANLTNARIYVDNIYTNHYAPETYKIGTGTPQTHISPGQRTIRLEKSGYNPLEKTLTIPTSSDTTIHFDLQPTTPTEPPPPGQPLPLDLEGLDALIERGEHVLDELDAYLQRIKELV